MPSHPDRVRKNYEDIQFDWICSQCFLRFKSKKLLDQHLKDQTVIIDFGPQGPITSNMHWSGFHRIDIK